jgi:hypothetical protein
MNVPCSACGSTNTDLIPAGWGRSSGGLVAKISRALLKITKVIPKNGPVIGQFEVICKDCGAKYIIFIN